MDVQRLWYLTLKNLSFANPQTIVDLEDDGTFSFCSDCSEVGYVDDSFEYLVSHFTTYSSRETPIINPPGGSSGGGSGIIGGVIPAPEIPAPVLPSVVEEEVSEEVSESILPDEVVEELNNVMDVPAFESPSIGKAVD